MNDNMKRRAFAVKAFADASVENVKKLVMTLKRFQHDADVTVCVPAELESACAAYEEDGMKLMCLERELDNYPKRHNAIVKAFRERGEDIFLHMIEGHVILLEDPSKMIDDIEKMMRLYDQRSWLGTVTDGCNLVYSKYCPRVNVVIDQPEFMQLGLDAAVFCSHANTQWIAVDLPLADDNEVILDEQFTIDMFYIIELLARRRNTHPGTLYFMNQYCTVSSEKGVYKADKALLGKEDIGSRQHALQEEDKTFKSMNISFTPDNNVDMVLERLAEQLKKKKLALSTQV